MSRTIPIKAKQACTLYARSTKANHGGIFDVRFLKSRPIQEQYADVWRAIVAAGSKGIIIPMWWLMGGAHG